MQTYLGKVRPPPPACSRYKNQQELKKPTSGDTCSPKDSAKYRIAMLLPTHMLPIVLQTRRAQLLSPTISCVQFKNKLQDKLHVLKFKKKNQNLKRSNIRYDRNARLLRLEVFTQQ